MTATLAGGSDSAGLGNDPWNSRWPRAAFLRHAARARPGMISVLEGLYRGAGADQVAIAIGLVDAAHRGPVLAPVVAGQRVGTLLPRVRVLPVGGEQHRRGVRRVGQRVVLVVVVTAGDPGDLLPDRDHRTAEPVDLG